MNSAPSIVITKPSFRLPTVRGIIERRMLVNFRCAPDVLAQMLPPPFRPKLVHGWGMAGICLIRLSGIRPAFQSALARVFRTGHEAAEAGRCSLASRPPPHVAGYGTYEKSGAGGLRSENAAHRIAVEWDEDGVTRDGVFIPRRDTNSFLNRFAGGRLFPGMHHAASFRVWETGARLKLEMRSADGAAFVRVLARVTETLPDDSVFNSLDEATSYFQAGAVGWSPRREHGKFDGLELSCNKWRMEPLIVERVESSFFQNHEKFPPGSVEFDCALLMRGISHEWRALGVMDTRETRRGKP